MSVLTKVDEDLPAEFATILRAAGHDSLTVFDQGHSGLPDDQLWSHVQVERRVLLTADKGFANARDYPPGSHAGVVLFRLRRESRQGYVRLVELMLERFNLADAVGAIVIVSPDAIRVRRASAP